MCRPEVDSDAAVGRVPSGPWRLLGVDCEMCATSMNDKELLQVAVVDETDTLLMQVRRDAPVRCPYSQHFHKIDGRHTQASVHKLPHRDAMLCTSAKLISNAGVFAPVWQTRDRATPNRCICVLCRSLERVTGTGN